MGCPSLWVVYLKAEVASVAPNALQSSLGEGVVVWNLRGEAEAPGLVRLGSILSARKLLLRWNRPLHGGAWQEDNRQEACVETRVLLSCEMLFHHQVSPISKHVAQRGCAASILGGINVEANFYLFKENGQMAWMTSVWFCSGLWQVSLWRMPCSLDTSFLFFFFVAKLNEK